MNEHRTDLPDDGEDLARLYREAHQPEPSPALDAAIRGAAHAALEREPRAGAWRRHGRLALAAAVVLGASLLVLMPREVLFPPGEEAPRPVPATQGDARVPPPAPQPERALRSDTEHPPPGEAEAGRALRRPAPTASDAQSQAGSARTTPRSAPAPAAPPRPAPGALAPDPAEAYYHSSPELWIAHIERLLSEGRFAEARVEFEAFQRRYPKHPYAQVR